MESITFKFISILSFFFHFSFWKKNSTETPKNEDEVEGTKTPCKVERNKTSGESASKPSVRARIWGL